MAIVVSDTSPIRCLANLGLVPLLRDLFGAVYIPPAVAGELAGPRGLSKPLDVRQWPWIELAMPADPQCVSRLSGDRRLHPGEVEAIALAIEKGAILLMDERVGTRIATSQGLMVVGVTGILIRAKRASLVPAVAPLLIELRDVYRFHVSDELLRTARQLAHEE